MLIRTSMNFVKGNSTMDSMTSNSEFALKTAHNLDSSNERVRRIAEELLGQKSREELLRFGGNKKVAQIIATLPIDISNLSLEEAKGLFEQDVISTEAYQEFLKEILE